MNTVNVTSVVVWSGVKGDTVGDGLLDPREDDKTAEELPGRKAELPP